MNPPLRAPRSFSIPLGSIDCGPIIATTSVRLKEDLAIGQSLLVKLEIPRRLEDGDLFRVILYDPSGVKVLTTEQLHLGDFADYTSVRVFRAKSNYSMIARAA